jgi:hypothetical protein
MMFALMEKPVSSPIPSADQKALWGHVLKTTGRNILKILFPGLDG